MPTPAPSAPRSLRFAARDLPLDGVALGELRDANHLLGDAAALARRMDEDGYLLVRGLHDPALVVQARREMADRLAADGLLDPAADPMDLVPRPGWNGGFYGGANPLTDSVAYRRLVDHDRVMAFFAGYFAAPVRAFDYRWLRVVAPGEWTGAHLDVVYMGRGTQRLITCWTPIGDVAYGQGPLAICVGSHRLPGFARLHETYGRMDVDRDRVRGWFSEDPLEIVERFGGRWATAEFRAGDALLFGMRTLHASLTNVDHRLRLSSDTRYQPADEPADERWVGERPIGHYAWHEPGGEAMAEARARWGV